MIGYLKTIIIKIRNVPNAEKDVPGLKPSGVSVKENIFTNVSKSQHLPKKHQVYMKNIQMVFHTQVVETFLVYLSIRIIFS